MTEQDSFRRPLRMTRRRALAVGAAGVSLAACLQYARYVVGDEFEDHVASVFGLSKTAARRLLASARTRLGDGDYDARAAAFLAATTFPGALVLPEGARREAIDSLVIPMIGTTEENLVALGLRPNLSGRCGGLLQP